MPRQMWPTTHGVAPRWWLFQFRAPGPTTVVTHAAQHPRQQQLSPGGVRGALLDECVRAIAVGGARSKIRAASVVPRVGLHQMKETHAHSTEQHPQQIKVTSSANDRHDARAIHRFFQVRTMRKSTPSKPQQITHGLVLDVPCHNHCSFAPCCATPSTRALTCCSMSLCSCMYRFHRYRFWTLGSTPRNDTQHERAEHIHKYTRHRNHVHTCALTPPLQSEECQQAAELHDSIPRRLAAPKHDGNWKHGEASAGGMGTCHPREKERHHSQPLGYIHAQAYPYILHVDIANHLSATPSRDIHFTHALQQYNSMRAQGQNDG